MLQSDIWLNDLLIQIGVFLLAIIIHELGHIIAHIWITKKMPTINFKWYGIEIASKKENKEITYKQLAMIAYSGIWPGLLVIIFLRKDLLIPYLFACVIDISIMTVFFSSSSELVNEKMKYIHTYIEKGTIKKEIR